MSMIDYSGLNSVEKMRAFIQQYPNLSGFTNGIKIDWNDSKSFGLMPMGQSTISRKEDILGDIILKKQYNFALYANRFTIEDVMRIETIGFLDDFSEWIEEQSIRGDAPNFGDNPEAEEISAQNGMLYQMYEDGKAGRYQIQIKVLYEKHFSAN